MLSAPMLLSQISQDPEIRVLLCDGRMEIFHLYKQQIKTFYATQEAAKEERIKSFVDEVYTPYKEYWSAWFSEEDFVK